MSPSLAFLMYAFLGLCAVGAVFTIFSLVVNSGFLPPQKTRINESVALDCKTAIKIYEQDQTTYEWHSTLVEKKDSPATLEYLDRLTAHSIEHFTVPVEYNPKTKTWDKKNFLSSKDYT